MAGRFPNAGFHWNWDSHDLKHIYVGARNTGVTTYKLKDHFMMDYIRHHFPPNCFLSHKGQRSHASHSGPSIMWVSSHQSAMLPNPGSVRGFQHLGLCAKLTIIWRLWEWLGALCFRLRSCFIEIRYKTSETNGHVHQVLIISDKNRLMTSSQRSQDLTRLHLP